jgi:hypothetical protein
MKKIFFSLFLFGILFQANAQRFMHGAGVGIFITEAPLTEIGGFGTLTYSPRFNMYETASFSLSVGVPLNVGLSGSYEYDYYNGYGSGQNTIRFMFNAPLMVNFNVGAGSTKNNEKRLGFFAGGGFGLHYGDYQYATSENGYDYYGNKYGATFGPSANLGLRFAVGSHRKNIEARLSYMKGVTTPTTSVYGAGALFNF